jgi:hypothetical protein
MVIPAQRCANGIRSGLNQWMRGACGRPPARHDAVTLSDLVFDLYVEVMTRDALV